MTCRVGDLAITVMPAAIRRRKLPAWRLFRSPRSLVMLLGSNLIGVTGNRCSASGHIGQKWSEVEGSGHAKRSGNGPVADSVCIDVCLVSGGCPRGEDRRIIHGPRALTGRDRSDAARGRACRCAVPRRDGWPLPRVGLRQYARLRASRDQVQVARWVEGRPVRWQCRTLTPAVPMGYKSLRVTTSTPDSGAPDKYPTHRTFSSI